MQLQSYFANVMCCVHLCAKSAAHQQAHKAESESQAMQVENDWKSRLCDFSLCSDRTTDRRSGNVPNLHAMIQTKKITI